MVWERREGSKNSLCQNHRIPTTRTRTHGTSHSCLRGSPVVFLLPLTALPARS